MMDGTTVFKMQQRKRQISYPIYMMIEFQDHIPDALVEDFGHRSPIVSKFPDIAAVLIQSGTLKRI